MSDFRRSGMRCLVALATAMLLLPGGLLAQEPPRPATPPASLSLDQALRLARENNPLYLQQKNDVDVAQSSVRAAYGGLLPTAQASTSFGYTAPGELRFQSRVLGSEPEAYFSAYNLGMGYQLSGSALLQPSVEKAQRRAVERRVTGAAANLDAQVTQQYLLVLEARERAAQAVKELERSGEYLRLAQARLEVGVGTPLDVRRAEVQRGRAEVAIVQANNNAAIAALTLGQLIGVSIEPEAALSSEFRIFEPTWKADELVETALQHNPVLKAAEASSSAARTTVKAARSTYLPTLNLNLGLRGYVNQYGDIDPLVDRSLGNLDFEGCQRSNRILALIGESGQTCLDPSDPTVRESVRQRIAQQNRGFPFSYIDQPWQASMTISLPVFTGFSRQLQIDQARAAAVDARQEVRAQELRLRQEVESGVRNLQTAYRTALLQEQVRANAEEELRLAQERFRFGAASSIEVTDAQANLAQAEQEQIAAVYSFHRSLAALEALVGRSLR